MSLTLQYLNETDIREDQYFAFLKAYYGDRLPGKIERFRWYSSWGNYKVLLALDGEEIVGQNCAYQVETFTNDGIQTIWWGVDAFVLSSHRGQGIGKKLQAKMFADLPGFSSASYSRVNGIIKRKLGAEPLFVNKYWYYPVSNFFALFSSLVVKKLFNKDLYSKPFKLVPFLYHCSPRRSGLSLAPVEPDDALAEFLFQNMRRKYDWFVVRSRKFLQWKYQELPSIMINVKGVYKAGKMVGFVAYSDVYNMKVIETPVRCVKIMDIVADEASGITNKMIIRLVVEDIKKKGDYVDGVLSNIALGPKLKIEYHTLPVLSSLNVQENIDKPYLTLADQDMEQI